MSNIFKIKQNDTWPPIYARLEDVNGEINLNNATVRFLMRTEKATELKVDGTAHILTPVEREAFDTDEPPNVKYSWNPDKSDTDTVGEYLAEWEATYDDGSVQTFPNVGYNAVVISKELD